MNLSASKQRIKDRREAVINAYKETLENKGSVTILVKSLSKKYKVTEVTIYNDIENSKSADKAADDFSKACDIIKNI